MFMNQQVILPFKAGSKVLEVGGGDQPLFRPNLDMRSLPTVDYVCNLEEKWPVPDASFDGVFGKFIIEHVSWRKTGHFALECFRILKPGGVAFLIGPNTLEQCKEIAKLNRIGIEESALIFGGQEEPAWNEHKAAFSPDYAVEIYKKAGFERVEIETWPGQIWTGAKTDMIIRAWKGDKTMAQQTPQPAGISEISQPGGLTQAPWYKELEDKMKGSQAPSNNIKLGLNIGSFTVMTKSTGNTQWINCDILDLNAWAQQNGFEFKQFDARQVMPWPDSSVDLIIASHFLEHITRAEGDQFLKECFRVLKPGGILRITVPDTKLIAQSFVWQEMISKGATIGGNRSIKSAFSFNEGVKNAEDECEAFWNLLTVGHITAYDEDSLGAKMNKASFTTYKCNPGESNSPEIKAETKDMYPELSLYVEGVKPDLVHTLPAESLKPTHVAAIDRVSWIREQARGARSVVDIGCFDAPATRNLQNCTWVDVLSYEQITELSKQQPPFPREKFVQTDAARLPFTDRQFGVAILSEILEHVALPLVVLKEAARVAEKVLVTVPNEGEWDAKRNPFTNPGNVRVYTEQLLRQHLEEAGYKDYQLGRLDYDGWSFLTVTANTSVVSPRPTEKLKDAKAYQKYLQGLVSEGKQ
jgi:predicted SAM-dependent methyltransferase